MPRQRSPNRKKAYELWLASGGKIRNTEIAKQLHVSADLICKWKRQDDWEQNKSTKRKKPTKQKPTKQNTTKQETISDDDAKEQADSFHVVYDDDMTDKQRLFCIYYINSFNATLSYKRAYQCSYVTAASEGPRMLRNHRVKEYIDHLKEIRYQATLASADDVVELYMRIAFANMNQHVVVKKGHVFLADSEDIDGQIVEEIKETQSGVSIKLNDRMKALQWLSDYFELNPKDQHKRDYDKRVLELKAKMIEDKEW